MTKELNLGYYGLAADWTKLTAAPHSEFQAAMNNGECLIAFWAPREDDTQTPHDRDEVYVVTAGSAVFSMDNSERSVKAGDLIFVPAGKPHRFLSFSKDIAMWVVFFGKRHDGFTPTL